MNIRIWRIGYHNYTMRAKRRRYRIVNTSSKKRWVKAYRGLLKVSKATEKYSESCIVVRRESKTGRDRGWST